MYHGRSIDAPYQLQQGGKNNETASSSERRGNVGSHSTVRGGTRTCGGGGMYLGTGKAGRLWGLRLLAVGPFDGAGEVAMSVFFAESQAVEASLFFCFCFSSCSSNPRFGVFRASSGRTASLCRGQYEWRTASAVQCNAVCLCVLRIMMSPLSRESRVVLKKVRGCSKSEAWGSLPPKNAKKTPKQKTVLVHSDTFRCYIRDFFFLTRYHG